MTVQDNQGNLHKGKDPDGGRFLHKQYSAYDTDLDQQNNSERPCKKRETYKAGVNPPPCRCES